MKSRTSRRGAKRRSNTRRVSGWVIAGAVVPALAAVLILVLAGGDSSEPAASLESPQPPAGPAAPDITLPGFDGETVRLSDFRGQGLVVNFWASWCVPCLAEMPGFEQVYQRYRDDGVAFLGVNLTDDPDIALRVAEQTGITYPLARDVDGAAFVAFGGFGMPTTVFISPDGSVVDMYTGELTASQLEDRIISYFVG